METLLVNEDDMGPKMNPLKEPYWKQFGGGPTEAQLKSMDPAKKARPGK
jgi:arylsulfatase